MFFTKIRHLDSSIETLNTNLAEFCILSKEAHGMDSQGFQELKSAKYYFLLSIILIMYNIVYVILGTRFIRFRPAMEQCLAVNLQSKTQYVNLPWKRNEKVNFTKYTVTPFQQSRGFRPASLFIVEKANSKLNRGGFFEHGDRQRNSQISQFITCEMH